MMMKQTVAVLAVSAAALTLAACNRSPDPAASAAGGAASGPAPSTASPATPGAGAGSAYEQAERGKGFSVGPMMAAQVVYVYFDPACPHCAQLWNATQPLKDKLRIVWVPVGFLRSTSAGQGATILAAADPSAAMTRNEASILERGQGIPIDPQLPDGLLDQVKANTVILEKMGAQSVPYIVFKHARTGQVGTHAGAMDTAAFAQLVGL